MTMVPNYFDCMQLCAFIVHILHLRTSGMNVILFVASGVIMEGSDNEGVSS